MADKWMVKTTNQILEETLELYNLLRTAGSNLAKRSPNKDQSFPYTINNYNELIDRTSFSKLVERRTSSSGGGADHIAGIASQSLGRSSVGGGMGTSISQMPHSSKILKGVPFKRGAIYVKISGFFSDSWEERLALLDGKVFYYAEESNDEGKLKVTLPLEGATIEESTDPLRPLVFKLIAREGKPTVLLSGLNRFDHEE